MSNVWADQPREAEGQTILHIQVGPNTSLQVQVVEYGAGITNYSGTIGGMFGSKTIISTDLVDVLKQVHAIIRKDNVDLPGQRS